MPALAQGYFGQREENNFRQVTVNSQSDGTSTLSNLDGTVISIQIDGTEETRPEGTVGPYEKCIIFGNVAVYFPSPGYPTSIYPFGFFARLPNE